MTRELLQQALDALESVYSRKPLRDLDETICALRSALAAPMPEPVAFVDGDEAHRKIIWSKCVASFDYEIGAPLYAAPPAAPAPAVCDGGTCGLGGYCANCPRQSAAPVVREPLKPWEFVAMWATAAKKHLYTYDTAVEFGRAVEAHHGITGGGK